MDSCRPRRSGRKCKEPRGRGTGTGERAILAAARARRRVCLSRVPAHGAGTAPAAPTGQAEQPAPDTLLPGMPPLVDPHNIYAATGPEMLSPVHDQRRHSRQQRVGSWAARLTGWGRRGCSCSVRRHAAEANPTASTSSSENRALTRPPSPVPLVPYISFRFAEGGTSPFRRR